MANEYDGNIKANYESNTKTNFNNNESCKSERNSNKAENHNSTPTSSENGVLYTLGSAYGNSKATTALNENSQINDFKQMSLQPQRREENPFSFKHFLNRDTNNSSTTTIISTAIASGNSNTNNSNLVSSNNTSYQLSNSTNNHYSSVCSSSPVTTNNFSVINTHSCHVNQTNNNGNGNCNLTSDNNGLHLSGNQTINSTTMSSNSGFRSISSNPYQSSTGARPKVPQSISTSSSIGSGVNENSKMKRSPRFSSFDSQASLAECAAGSSIDQNESNTYNSASGCFIRDAANISDNPVKKNGLLITNSEYDRQFIPRSYSNYDIDVTPSVSNRTSNSSTITRETSNSTFRNRNPAAIRPNRLIGISSQSSSSTSKNQQHSSNTTGGGGLRSNSEFAAAALPDFVQDHWMDQWYYNEMHLNSPSNSPNQSPIDFVEDLPSCMPPGEKCQTLPDFLSDGPIIHSSGRLADVAAGLPDLDSPEDNSSSLQLSRIRLENDRLRRELDESRIALSEQIRRSNDLERRLEQYRNNQVLKKNSNQIVDQLEENSEENQKWVNATENEIEKLKLQIKKLTVELNVSRKENELMKERGAVGGDVINKKPSKNQQLSKELMRAATNAETNLRQLLSGVDNLRLIARSLVCDNNVDLSAEGLQFNRHSPILTAAAASGSVGSSTTINNLINEEYLSDCDDIEDLSGPAL